MKEWCCWWEGGMVMMLGRRRGQQEGAKRKSKEKKAKMCSPLICFALRQRWTMVYLPCTLAIHPTTLSSSPWLCNAMQRQRRNKTRTPCTIKEGRKMTLVEKSSTSWLRTDQFQAQPDLWYSIERRSQMPVNQLRLIFYVKFSFTQNSYPWANPLHLILYMSIASLPPRMEFFYCECPMRCGNVTATYS